VISTALKLLTTVRRNPMGRWLALTFAALTFVLIALLRLPLVWVVLGLGSLAIAVAWHHIGRTEPPR
jgi:chromate transporter